jgi:hypothetical protein
VRQRTPSAGGNRNAERINSLLLAGVVFESSLPVICYELVFGETYVLGVYHAVIRNAQWVVAI